MGDIPISEFDAVVNAIPRDEFWKYLKEVRQGGVFSTLVSSGIERLNSLPDSEEKRHS